MIKPTKKQINEMAQGLDGGMDVHFNLKTGKVIEILGGNLMEIDEETAKEAFAEQIEEIEETDEEDLISLTVLPSFEAFKIMEGFCEAVEDAKFKEELELALDRRKPFQNFKHAVDYSDYRQDWFDFKQNYLECYVEEQINENLEERGLDPFDFSKDDSGKNDMRLIRGGKN